MMKTYLLPILLLLTLGEEAPPKPHPQNQGGIDAKDSATISGIVLFKGAKPPAKPIADIAGNSFCKSCYKGELPTQDNVRFGKNGADDTPPNVLVHRSKGPES